MKLSILKCHGSGNDFVLIDLAEQTEPALNLVSPDVVRLLCDRRKLVGADGVLFLEGTGSSRTLRVFNADGTEAEISVNGVRCAGRYLCEQSGEQNVGLSVGGLSLTVGKVSPLVPEIQWYQVAIPGIRLLDSLQLQTTAASLPPSSLVAQQVLVPNPHLILFDAGLPAEAVETLATQPTGQGRILSEDFNLSTVDVLDEARWLERTYERGVGWTLSCGSAACAAAAAGLALNRLSAGSSVDLHSKGGFLRCTPRRSDSSDNFEVALVGNANNVFRANIDVDPDSSLIADYRLFTEDEEIFAYDRFYRAHEEWFAAHLAGLTGDPMAM